MSEKLNPWKVRFERERKARKQSEALLEEKSLELWKINQELEALVNERTESLKEALIKAEKADRAKSDFLANISHEIRTPLNAIIGFAHYLCKSEDLSMNNSRYASIIESSATSLLGIINDILDFSKIESGNFDISLDTHNIQKISDQVAELFLQKTKEKHIELIYNFDKRIPSNIITDGTRVRQVISNLLSNAIKFTPEQGKVTLDVNLISKSEHNAVLEFCVKDTGIGIPKEKIESVLNPFIQLEHVANKQNVGTGLGLSICNNILKLLDSYLVVESEVGSGSSFSFTLTSKISDLDEIEINSFDENNIDFKGNILLAEDNSANQELMKLILSKLNINCTVASNGQEAYELYKENNSFDLILMDINMPILSGLESLKKIRAYEESNNLEKTPTIALTANAIKGDKESFINQGMDDYLSKPIEVESFISVASKYLTITKKVVEEKNQTINKSIESNIIDINKITEKIGISENIAKLIVDKFKKEIQKDLKELELLIEKSNMEEVSNKAHYIKNSCLNVCLNEACIILEKMENNKLDNNQAKSLYQDLKEIIK